MSEKLAETRGKKQRVLVVSKLKRRHKLSALFRQLSFVKTFIPPPSPPTAVNDYLAVTIPCHHSAATTSRNRPEITGKTCARHSRETSFRRTYRNLDFENHARVDRRFERACCTAVHRAPRCQDAQCEYAKSILLNRYRGHCIRTKRPRGKASRVRGRPRVVGLRKRIANHAHIKYDNTDVEWSIVRNIQRTR